MVTIRSWGPHQIKGLLKGENIVGGLFLCLPGQWLSHLRLYVPNGHGACHMDAVSGNMGQ